MEIVGDRRFVEIPGGKTHELPPLLVNAAPRTKRLDRVMSMAAEIVESEDMIPVPELPASDLDLTRRKMDLAINLVEQYLTLVSHWQWGDSVLEWIRQCEITFDSRLELRNVLRADVWPHAGRSSFVQLLEDKSVDTGGVSLEEAVGLRLAFRQPPPISCCSNQFLLYLNPTVSTTAFETWAHLSPAPISCLPPERFEVQLVNMSLQ
jgi:hypothetical protein